MCHEEIEEGAVNLPFTPGRGVGCTVMLMMSERFKIYLLYILLIGDDLMISCHKRL